jgi:hypothetical protein
MVFFSAMFTQSSPAIEVLHIYMDNITLQLGGIHPTNSTPIPQLSLVGQIHQNHHQLEKSAPVEESPSNPHARQIYKIGSISSTSQSGEDHTIPALAAPEHQILNGEGLT